MPLLGRILWMLGYPDQALTQSHQALALAQEGARPEQLAIVLYNKAELHWRRREPAAALQAPRPRLPSRRSRGLGIALDMPCCGGAGRSLRKAGSWRAWLTSARAWPTGSRRGDSGTVV